MMRRLAWCGIIAPIVRHGEPVARQQIAAGFVHLADGVFENLLAVLVDVVLVLVDGLVGRRQAAAAGRHDEGIAARAIDLAHEIDEAQMAVAILSAGSINTGASAVAEQDAGGAVGVIDDAAHGVGADHQHLLVRAGGHQVAPVVVP
jgi:hypothetical protein